MPVRPLRLFIAVVPLLLISCASPPADTAAGIVTPKPRVTETTTQPWTFEGRTGQLIRCGSYELYTTLSPGQTVQRLPLFLESALDHYTTVLAPLPRPETPMETYVLANRAQWARLTQRTMGEDADIYLRIQRGGFSARGKSLLFFIGPRDTLAIAAHEGWHQYTQTMFKNPLPVWLEEGIATYMEGFRFPSHDASRPTFMPWANTERFDTLQTAASTGKLIALERLLMETPQDLMAKDTDAALVYYAQVWALVHFLAEGENARYAPILRRILADAAEGKLIARVSSERGSRAAQFFSARRRGPDVLLAYCDEPLLQLRTQYEAFIQSVTRPGVKPRIFQGQSPLAP